MNQLYVIQDSVSGKFGPPFEACTDEEVIRNMSATLNNETVPEYIFRDTAVFCVGCVDTSDGNYHINPYPIPRLTCRGSDFLGGDVIHEKSPCENS